MSDLVQLSHQLPAYEGPLVLVSLVGASGSTYRKPGARLLLTPFQTLGLMSGGCLEGEIARRCEPLFADRESFLHLDLDTRQFLGCDGRLSLWCERISADFLERAKAVATTRQSLVCRTYPHTERASVILDSPEPGAFNELLCPPRRVLVFGSAPDSQPLLELGRALTWQTEQVVMASDPNAPQDPQIKILAHSSQVSKLKIDETTACVVMNHHFGRDLELLSALWNSPTPFLGLLGSRKRRDQLLEQLTAQELRGELDLESRELYAPVGLNIGAEGAHQIGLAICAQIQEVMSSQDSLSRVLDQQVVPEPGSSKEQIREAQR